MNHLGNLLMDSRAHARLSRHQLAARIGYRNLNKGARRIEKLEAGQGDPGRILQKVVDVLQLSKREVDQAIRLDQEEHQQQCLAFLDEPIETSLTIRAVPGCFMQYPLPDDWQDTLELEQYACKIARKMGVYAFLYLPNHTVWCINPSGEVYLHKKYVYHPHRGIVLTNVWSKYADNTGIPPICR